MYFLIIFYFVFQSAVGYDYQGKTDKHASQKGLYIKLINDIILTHF